MTKVMGIDDAGEDSIRRQNATLYVSRAELQAGHCRDSAESVPNNPDGAEVPQWGRHGRNAGSSLGRGFGNLHMVPVSAQGQRSTLYPLHPTPFRKSLGCDPT